RLAPLDLTGRQLDAPQLGLRRVPAAGAVDVAVDVDGSVPVALQLLAARAGVVLPDDLGAARRDAEQHTAAAVALGQQHPIADDNRVGRVDALQRLGPPRELERDVSCGRLEPDEPVPRPVQPEPPAADLGNGRAGIAGQFVGGAVPLLAGALVEHNDAAAVALQVAEVVRLRAGRAAADRDDQQVPFDERRPADAEEVLDDVVLRLRIDVPERLAVGRPDAVQHALGAVGVDAVAVHDRAAAG